MPKRPNHLHLAPSEPTIQVKVDGVFQTRRAVIERTRHGFGGRFELSRYVPETRPGERLLDFIGGDMEIITVQRG